MTAFQPLERFPAWEWGRVWGLLQGSAESPGRPSSPWGEPTLPLPQTIVHLLAYSNEKKLQQMKCELQEWKEKEDSKMSCKNRCKKLLDLHLTLWGGHPQGTHLGPAVPEPSGPSFPFLGRWNGKDPELIACQESIRHFQAPCVFVVMGALSLQPPVRQGLFSYFTDEETEAKRSDVACRRLHS